MKSLALFNNNGGVGKTSLVYHLAWMYADLGLNVVAADLDPQANLTSMFLEDERLEALWTEDGPRQTVFGALQPLLEGTGDVTAPHVEQPAPGLGLVVGDLALSTAEGELSSQWHDCLDGKPHAFRVISGLWRVLRLAAEETAADAVLVDVGPDLGAFNRAALVSADFVLVPLAPDIYSLQGLRNLGPTLRRWQSEWAERRDRNPVVGLEVPPGTMTPIGYVVMPHAVRLDRLVNAYTRWMNRIPETYGRTVLDREPPANLTMDRDPSCLASLKHYRSLISLAQEARKPMFALKPADGAIGGHATAVQECYREFRDLALAVAKCCGFGPL
jgi:chromosome partitioning protein